MGQTIPTHLSNRLGVGFEATNAEHSDVFVHEIQAPWLGNSGVREMGNMVAVIR